MGDIDRDPELDREPPDPGVERVTGKASESGDTRDEKGKAAPRPGELETRPDESSDAAPRPEG